MDASRKANREADEITLQYQSPQETRLVEELNADKLKQLLTFISHLERTPDGSAELRRRTKFFGECLRREDETAGQFCARLRHWLDRDFPRAKSQRRARKQTSD